MTAGGASKTKDGATMLVSRNRGFDAP